MSSAPSKHIPRGPVDAKLVAEDWRQYGGDNPWTAALDRFGDLGGKVIWWCGYPRCASAIPLTFSLHMPDGTKAHCNYRLKDIRAAIALLERSGT